ncbi:Uncharacterised protein [Staphylococcus delphini]|nr:Uncharacterised protein [Staphylococcus delphini]
MIIYVRIRRHYISRVTEREEMDTVFKEILNEMHVKSVWAVHYEVNV